MEKVIGESTIVRPVFIDDNSKVFDSIRKNYDHITNYLDSPLISSATPEETKAILAKEEEVLRLGIWNDMNLAGMVTLECDVLDGLNLNGVWEGHAVEITYWLGKEYEGRGLMTRSVEFASEVALEKKMASLLFARVHYTNRASKRVLEKLGFSKEADDRFPYSFLRYVLEGRF